MPGGLADVVEVVVLAAGPDALLGGDGADVRALLAADEHVLELVHAGVGEEERGVAVRDDRARRHGSVAAGGEEIDEGRACRRVFS